MKIESAKVSNYKSFREPTECNLSGGFNIVVGKNNVGKTALLEALSLQFQPKPHRGGHQQRGHPVDPISLVEVTFSVTGKELERELLRATPSFHFPIAEENLNNHSRVRNDLMSLFNEENISFHGERDANNNWKILELPKHNIFTDLVPGKSTAVIEPDLSSGDFKVQSFHTGTGPANLITNTLMRVLAESIYTFKAERLNVATSPYGNKAILSPNAENLPEVLNLLQKNPVRFERLCSYVKDIFPNITNISLSPPAEKPNLIEIGIWLVDPKTERDDLIIPLSEAGTGVGQVLAILYVVLNSVFSRCIIIDEPNSFLHPGAAKKLIQILASYPQHQYIVATHGVEIIKSADPETILFARWEDGRTTLHPAQSEELEDMRLILAELGVRLSDVFGADDILWVEGPTEESCYPKIIQKVGKRPVLGTSIVAVRSTGDFERKPISATLIWEIYERLSGGSAIVPPAIGFLFDREGRSDTEREDLERRSRGCVKFLTRRCYENYLIIPQAIENVLNTLPTFKKEEIKGEQITDWIINNGGRVKYYDGGTELSDLTEKKWLDDVRGAVLLADLFSELSDGREEYRKTVHSVQLTDWLIEHEPEALAELSEILRAVLKDDAKGKSEVSIPPGKQIEP